MVLTAHQHLGASSLLRSARDAGSVQHVRGQAAEQGPGRQCCCSCAGEAVHVPWSCIHDIRLPRLTAAHADVAASHLTAAHANVAASHLTAAHANIAASQDPAQPPSDTQTTVVESLFSGRLASTVVCGSCGHTSTQLERFMCAVAGWESLQCLAHGLHPSKPPS